MTAAIMPAPRAPRAATNKRLASFAWHGLIVVLFAFLLAPVVIVVIMSIDTQPYLSFPPQGITLRWYASLIDNEKFIYGFKVSGLTALVASLIATGVGVPAAIALSRYRFPGRDVIGGLFIAPLMVPGVVLGLALLLALAPIGLTSTYTGLVIAHLAITIPYVIRTTMTALSATDAALFEEAAKTLGASNWTCFHRILLPLIFPGVIAGFAISFLISFDEAVLSLFLVGGSITTLPVEIFKYVSYTTDPQVAALSVVLILISLVLVTVIERSIGLRRALR